MKTVLLTGRTEFISPEIIENLSGRFSVVMTSDDPSKELLSGKLHKAAPGTSSFEELFWSYDFTAVWYFSPCCDGRSVTDDFSELQVICEQCRNSSVKELIVISSSLLSEEYRAREEDFLFQAKGSLPHTMLLRVPFIMTEDHKKTMLGSLFSALYRRKNKIALPDVEENTYEFLPAASLVHLMTRITLSSWRQGTFVIPGEYMLSKKQLEEFIRSINSKAAISYEKERLSYTEAENIQFLSEQYGYTIKDRRKPDINALYDEHVNREKQSGRGGLFERLASVRRRIPSNLLVVADIIVLFFVAEYINRFTSGSVYFKAIDVRLIFILLIATFHGLFPGVLAAICECVVLLLQYHQLGISSTQLFYNVENWIPFVLYIIVGAITGFFADLRENERALVDRENSLLREKYLFLNDIYNSTLEVKDAYRYQILGFEHSYGKIYHAIDRLTCDTTSEVFIRAQEVLSQLLDNSSVAIYQYDDSTKDACALPCSESVTNTSMEILPHAVLEENVGETESGIVWRNLQFNPGLPMYICKLSSEISGLKKPYLIAIWEALPEQMNDYYVNRFEILCLLTGQALSRACLTEAAAGVNREE